MCKLWVGHAYGSPAVNAKVEVDTLIHKNFPYTLVSSEHNSDGRVSHLIISHAGEELSLYNIYGPNAENKTIYQNLGVQVRQADSWAV